MARREAFHVVLLVVLLLMVLGSSALFMSAPSLAKPISQPYWSRNAASGHLGGPIQAVRVQGQYAYVGVGSELAIIDITEPEHPRRIGYVMMPGSVHSIALTERLAYVIWQRCDFSQCYESGLQVVDILTPTAPLSMGQYGLPNVPHDMAPQGDYLYLSFLEGSLESSGLRVLDISNAAQPIEVGRYITLSSTIAVQGAYAYLSVRSSLVVVDITDPTQPTLVASTKPAGTDTKYNEFQGHDLVVAGAYAYLVESERSIGSSRLRVVNIISPTTPIEVSITDITVGRDIALRLSVLGTYAYVVAGSSLQIFDIVTPGSPVERGIRSIFWNAVDSTIHQNLLYLASGSEGLRVISLEQPQTPTEIGAYVVPVGFTQLAGQGDYLYAAERSKLWVIEVANSRNPTVTQSIAITSTEPIMSMVPRADILYAAVGTSGLHLISTSARPTLTHLSSLNTAGFASAVAVTGSHAYVADGEEGVQIIDVADPSRPRLIRTYSGIGHASGIGIRGNHAYVMEPTTLWVLDISDPAAPIHLGSLELAGGVSCIGVGNGYVYAGTGQGFLVIDARDPTRPKIVGRSLASYDPQDMVVSGEYVYLTHSYAGAHLALVLMDVTDPLRPTPVSTQYILTGATAVWVKDEASYVGSAEDGLYWFELSDMIVGPLPNHIYLPLMGGSIMQGR